MTDCFGAVMLNRNNALSLINELDDINTRDDDGRNLLHIAIAYKNQSVALELLRRGIDVDAQTSDGGTPLHGACTWNNAEVAEKILEQGGDISIVDKHGNTPLWTAVFNVKGRYYDIVNLMVKHGASKVAHLKNKHGRSPYDFAMQVGNEKLAKLISE